MKKYQESELDYKVDGDCKLQASKIAEDFATYFKTRERYRDGARVGYDRLWISVKAESRDWIKSLGLEGDCFVFGLGNKNIDFVTQGDKIFYSVEAGAQAREYVKAWSRLLDKKYNGVEIYNTHVLPRGPRTSRSSGRKIQTLDDLMEATLCKDNDRDYGI